MNADDVRARTHRILPTIALEPLVGAVLGVVVLHDVLGSMALVGWRADHWRRRVLQWGHLVHCSLVILTSWCVA